MDKLKQSYVLLPSFRPTARANRDLSQVLDYNNMTAVVESNFNASLPIKIIIHGFGSTCLRLWAREMRVSFLAVVSFEFSRPSRGAETNE